MAYYSFENIYNPSTVKFAELEKYLFDALILIILLYGTIS